MANVGSAEKTTPCFSRCRNAEQIESDRKKLEILCEFPEKNIVRNDGLMAVWLSADLTENH